MLRDGIARLKEQFGLAVEQINLQQMLTGEFNLLWIWFQETRTKRLRGYGAVDEELSSCLDPQLDEMIGIIDQCLRTCAET